MEYLIIKTTDLIFSLTGAAIALVITRHIELWYIRKKNNPKK